MIDNQEVDRALQHDEFLPYFQPLVDLRTGEIAGFELLARWNHWQRGMIQPDEFIPIAERDGWIGALTHTLLRQAFYSAASIPAPLVLAVNISPLQLRDLTLPRQIEAAATKSGFALSRLIIEVTETALVDNQKHAVAIARELKAIGCKLALDDFGTGHSSLAHLQSLPFDELKIDRSFVSSMGDRRESRKIVAAVIGLGQSLGLTTVAEGIETQEHADMLLWMGCDQGQGWLYGRPLPAEALPEVLSKLRMSDANRRPSAWSAALTGNGAMEAPPNQRLAQLQALYDGAPVGLSFLDRKMRFVSLNQRLADLNGITIEAHLGRSITEILPQHIAEIEPCMRRALAGEAIAGIEIKRVHAQTKQEVTLLVSYQPALDEAEEVVGVSVAIVDISEVKRADAALRESEDHYRRMVELNPQAPWIMDPEGRSLDVSPAWETTTRTPVETERDRRWLSTVHPDDLEATQNTIATCLREGLPISVEYRARSADGSWRWMHSRGDPRFDAAGRVVCWAGSVEDIDERKKIDEALRKSTAVLSALPVGMVVAEAKSDIVTVANPRAQTIFRETGSETAATEVALAAALPWVAPVPDGMLMASSRAPLERALIFGEATEPEEVLCERSDGTHVLVQRAAVPVIVDDGTIAGAIVVIQDMAEVKRARNSGQAALLLAHQRGEPSRRSATMEPIAGSTITGEGK